MTLLDLGEEFGFIQSVTKSQLRIQVREVA